MATPPLLVTVDSEFDSLSNDIGLKGVAPTYANPCFLSYAKHRFLMRRFKDPRPILFDRESNFESTVTNRGGVAPAG